MKYRVLLSFAVVVAACSSKSDNDQPAAINPNPLGPGMRLRDVQDPTKNLAGQKVGITSAVVTAVDVFDETSNGKSRGTIFVQDADIAGPYAGISMYSPTFVPANLRLAPGDVVDVSGQYVQQTTIGTTVNFSPAFLPQMNKPQVQQRFETLLPQPVVVPLSDLMSFDTGRKWIGMLVTIEDVTVLAGPTNSGGRVQAQITPSVANGAAINNELWNLQAYDASNPTNPSSFAPGTHFKSVTGIVDFFFNLFIAPRSAADLVP